MDTISKKEMVAPCGMYCGVCDKYLAYSHSIPKKRGRVCHCIGCKPANKNCSFIKKKCVSGRIHSIEYCYECEVFPCDVLSKGSKKYSERYGVHFVENLNLIQTKGVDNLIEHLESIFKCNKCGDTICIHNQKCYTCDRDEIN